MTERRAEIGITRLEVAECLLRETELRALQLQVKRSKHWSGIFRGFRPDFVPRRYFVRAATSFSSNMSLLASLCSVYLESIGVQANSDLQARFREAADRVDVPDEARRLATALSEVDLQDLPLSAVADADGEVSEEAPAIADSETPTSERPHVADVVTPHVNGAPPVGEAYDQPVIATAKYISAQVMLDWQAPDDHVSEVQQAVTLFERALLEFVQRQLSDLHGDKWLERGCSMHKDWKVKAGRAVSPRTMLGYAELGDVRDVIVSNTNWSAFNSYFPNKDWLRRQFDDIIPLRVSAAHAGQRELRLLDQAAGLSSMEKVVREFHEPTADTIHGLFEAVYDRTRPESQLDIDPPRQTAGLAILTNLGDFQPPRACRPRYRSCGPHQLLGGRIQACRFHRWAGRGW